MKKLLALLLICCLAFSLGSGCMAETLRSGEYVTFGSYPQTADGTDRTPIEWIVLEERDGKKLLISRYGLDVTAFNNDGGSTWENCSLRAWLNNDFLNAAFTEEEQARIQLTDVDNSAAQGYKEWSTADWNDTQDKIFLLSYAEVEKYFGAEHETANSNEAAAVIPTEYAKKAGAYMPGGPTSYWWLRSPGKDKNCPAYVATNGGLYGHLPATEPDACARPSIWVDLDSADSGTSRPETPVGDSAFIFRNGVTWGMSMADVKGLEEGECQESEADQFKTLFYQSVKVSKYTAGLGYAFRSDALVLCAYIFEDPDEAKFSYLEQAFDTKYGEQQADAAGSFLALAKTINPEFYNEEDVQAFRLCQWKAAGDTSIWLVWETNGSNTLSVVYTSPELVKPAEEEINLDGI